MLLSRGMVYEARQSWRAALRIEPANSAAQDYLASTEHELNDYDRKREEAARRLEDSKQDRVIETWDAGADVDQVTIPGQPDAGPSGEDERLTALSALAQVGQALPGMGRGAMGEPGLHDDSQPTPGTEPIPGPRRVEEEGVEPARLPDAPAVRELAGGGDVPDESPDTESTVSTEPSPDGAPDQETMASDDWEPLDWLGDDTEEDTPIDAMEETAFDEDEQEPIDLPTAGRDSPLQAVGPLSPAVSSEDEKADPASDVLREVTTLLEKRDFGSARRVLQAELETNPGHEPLLEELERVERDMQAYYARLLGDLDSVPELTVDMDDLYSLEFDQVGGYIISLVDGILTLEDIFTLSAQVDRLTVMQVLGDLLEKELVTLKRT